MTVALVAGSAGGLVFEAPPPTPRASTPAVSAAPTHAVVVEPPVVNAPGGAEWGGGDPSAPMWASVPTRLQVPAIGVDTGLIPLGLAANGALDVPPSGFPAGWYTGAPTPGELGPAVITGHIDWNGPGVFFALRKLTPGAVVTVTRADGSTAVFTVTEVAEYGKSDFPTELVYGGLDYAGLRLVTCGGKFNRKAGHYEDNIVVFASLVSSTPPTPVDPPVVVRPPVTPVPTPVASVPWLVTGRRAV